MNLEESRRLIENATNAMQSFGNRPILLQMDIRSAVGLIGIVQLALRHPLAADHTSAGETRRLILELIEGLDPERGDFYKLLIMGFDPQYDDLLEKAGCKHQGAVDLLDGVATCVDCGAQLSGPGT